MDREKRRSEEEEAELDRKIALIREKNLKYEQRLQEIEEDRLLNGSVPQKPSQETERKPRNSQTNGKWSREWDKGKTPVETWRENVPSIDLKDRLAGAKAAKGARGPKKENANPQKKSSRLEGRISSKEETPEAEAKPQKTNNRRRGGRGGEKKPEGIDNQVSNDRPVEGKSEEKKDPKKPRRVRKESDNYAVKKVVRSLVDRVIQLDKKLKREEKKEKETTIEEGNEEKKEKQEEEEGGGEEESPNCKSDSNQNVITLVEEKVAEVIISTN